MLSNFVEVSNRLIEARHGLEEAESELALAEADYVDSLVGSAVNELLGILESDGTLTERDVRLIVGDVARRVSQL